jgi:hypothetical protein
LCGFVNLSRRGGPAPPDAIAAEGAGAEDHIESSPGRTELPPGQADAPGQAGVPLGQPGQPDTGSAPGTLARFARRHALFAAVTMAAIIVRVIAMLGFRGPLLYPDSTSYVVKAVRLTPGLVRPSGYSVMLWLLLPLHSLMAVIGLQHAMGVGLGVVGYVLLRRAGLPGWGATVAMVPTLLSAYAVQIEHFPVSDTLFAVLVMIAIALMMWWPVPPVWACGLTGLLLAAASLARTQGFPLLIVFLAYVLVKFARWRTVAGVAAMCVAFAVPVAGYAAWFHSFFGTYKITRSNGAFLYAGVATFADCAKIKPPPAERPLCLNVPPGEREWAAYYIFSGPIRALPGGPFGKLADGLGSSFALRAVRAQPLDYVRAASRSFWETFLLPPSINAPTIQQRIWALAQIGYMFPAAPPKLPPRSALRGFTRYDPAGPGLHLVQPYAGWIRTYQRYVVVPGPLLGVIVLTGLGGLLLAWRRFGGPALLPWLVGCCLLATPAAIVEFDPRYLVSTIPPLCMAAAIGIQQAAAAAKRLRAGHS